MAIIMWIILGIVSLGFSVATFIVLRGVIAIVRHERRWKRIQKDLYHD